MVMWYDVENFLFFYLTGKIKSRLKLMINFVFSNFFTCM